MAGEASVHELTVPSHLSIGPGQHLPRSELQKCRRERLKEVILIRRQRLDDPLCARIDGDLAVYGQKAPSSLQISEVLIVEKHIGEVVVEESDVAYLKNARVRTQNLESVAHQLVHSGVHPWVQPIYKAHAVPDAKRMTTCNDQSRSILINTK